MTVADKKSRLFFALWPSQQIRATVEEVASPLLHEVDGRIITPENFHITLHFIGSVTDEVKHCLHQSAQSVTCEAFDLRLDHFGFFSKAKIFWMAPQFMPPQLTRLHNTLGNALTACDFQPDLRAYSPHVSLLRKAGKTAVDYPAFSINWHVDEFVLIESCSNVTGVSYKVLERYPLQA